MNYPTITCDFIISNDNDFKLTRKRGVRDMNLQYWRDPQKISRRVAREVLELTDYDYEIHHLKGKENGRADTLSRRPDYDQGEGDNEGVMVLPDEVFVKVAQEDQRQDEDVICPWVDPHQLKKVAGRWEKQG